MSIHKEREFREHKAEIEQWGEYIRLELGRGKSEEEIMSVLKKNGMTAETAEIVLQAAEAGF